MKLHSLTKLCTNTTASLCDALMTSSMFRREFIFRIDIVSNCRHFGSICVANFIIFRPTLDTTSGKNLNNEAVWAGKSWTRSKSDFCFHMSESTGLGPFLVDRYMLSAGLICPNQGFHHKRFGNSWQCSPGVSEEKCRNPINLSITIIWMKSFIKEAIILYSDCQNSRNWSPVKKTTTKEWGQKNFQIVTIT